MKPAPYQVDLTNCDREPIHIPGSIQPHGAMLVVAGEDYAVSYASANAPLMLGVDPKSVIGRPLAEVIGDSAAHAVRNVVSKSAAPAAPGLFFNMRLDKPGAAQTAFDLAAHRYQDRTFIELQPASEEADAYGPLELTRSLVRRLANETSVDKLAASAARMVAMMLGYDRVMVYKLLHNGAGHVIAEQRRPQLQSFLNQHFPASDIPVQARELYKRNWIRMIGDVRYIPQPMLPQLGKGDRPLDMSYAQLRSVSPIHCEYLQNMGVSASMSISILVEGELWGLIACHHYSSKIVPLPLRIGAELFGQYFSLQVETLERRTRFEAAQEGRVRLDRIVAELPPEQELHESLAPHLADLARLLPCDGVGVWIEGQWLKHGAAPPDEALKPLTGFLNQTVTGDLWSTNQLPKLLPEADVYVDIVAGVLAVPLSRTPRDYLLFFRSEESRFVEWAGDPDKPIHPGPLGDRLTPRKSFELWREEVRGQSTPWNEADLAIADAAQNYLRDVVLRHMEATSEERKRSDIRRRLINEELHHRVKNILAVTKSLVAHSRSASGTVAEFGDALNGRLRALSFAHDQIGAAEGGDMRRLIESELHAYGGDALQTGRLKIDGPEMRLSARAYSSLALAIHELSTNAAKYGALSAPAGKVSVSWRRTPEGCRIDWMESGGPPVTAPKRSGFGSTLIGQVIPFDLDGEAEIDYPAAGAKAHFVIPSRHVMALGDAARDARQAVENAPTHSVDLRGLKVLLVEDQVLIALDADYSLRQLGAAQVAIAPTSEEAMKQIKAMKPDLAVLDVNLGETTSAPVAEALRDLGVPFVFATGYGDMIMIPESMRSTPVVRKPYGEQALAAAISAALAKGG